MSEAGNKEATEAAAAEPTTASTTATGLAEPSGVEDGATGPDESSAAEDKATAATPTTGPEGSSAAEDGAEGRANPRKIREGIVVSNGMDKTAVVEAIDRVRHSRYAKTVQRSTRLFAHDENNDANVSDRVRIQETRPLSKKKRWRLVEIIERAR